MCSQPLSQQRFPLGSPLKTTESSPENLTGPQFHLTAMSYECLIQGLF